jgi:hypothetical protein
MSRPEWTGRIFKRKKSSGNNPQRVSHQRGTYKRFPQLAETNTTHPKDVNGECPMYYEFITRIYFSNPKSEKHAVKRGELL